jgi:exonuclease III
MVQTHWKSHEPIREHLIVTLYFKQNKIIVTQIYIPPNDKDQRDEVLRQLRMLIEDTEHDNSNYLIILGDFNAVVDPMLNKSTNNNIGCRSKIFDYLNR